MLARHVGAIIGGRSLILISGLCTGNRILSLSAAPIGAVAPGKIDGNWYFIVVFSGYLLETGGQLIVCSSGVRNSGRVRVKPYIWIISRTSSHSEAVDSCLSDCYWRQDSDTCQSQCQMSHDVAVVLT